MSMPEWRWLMNFLINIRWCHANKHGDCESVPQAVLVEVAEERDQGSSVCPLLVQTIPIYLSNMLFP